MKIKLIFLSFSLFVSSFIFAEKQEALAGQNVSLELNNNSQDNIQELALKLKPILEFLSQNFNNEKDKLCALNLTFELNSLFVQPDKKQSLENFIKAYNIVQAKIELINLSGAGYCKISQESLNLNLLFDLFNNLFNSKKYITDNIFLTNLIKKYFIKKTNNFFEITSLDFYNCYPNLYKKYIELRQNSLMKIQDIDSFIQELVAKNCNSKTYEPIYEILILDLLKLKKEIEQRDFFLELFKNLNSKKQIIYFKNNILVNSPEFKKLEQNINYLNLVKNYKELLEKYLAQKDTQKEVQQAQLDTQANILFNYKLQETLYKLRVLKSQIDGSSNLVSIKVSLLNIFNWTKSTTEISFVLDIMIDILELISSQDGASEKSVNQNILYKFLTGEIKVPEQVKKIALDIIEQKFLSKN